MHLWPFGSFSRISFFALHLQLEFAYFLSMNLTITSWNWLMSEVSDHLAMAFFCPSCKRTLRLNRHGIAEHRRECVDAPGGPPPWRCEKCNFTLPGETWMIFVGELFDSFADFLLIIMVGEWSIDFLAMGSLFPDSFLGATIFHEKTYDFSDEKGANLQRFGDGRFVSKARSFMGPFPKWMLNGGGVRTSPTCPNKQLTHPDTFHLCKKKRREKQAESHHRLSQDFLPQEAKRYIVLV